MTRTNVPEKITNLIIGGVRNNWGGLSISPPKNNPPPPIIRQSRVGKQVKSLQNLVSNSQAKIQSLAIQDMAKIEKIYKK